MKTEQIYNLLRAGKFKGHTRIILEDVRNGHRDIYEDHNMATNALPKIFECNYNGLMDFYNLMPLSDLLGGVYLFWNALTEDADNIFPPSQATNKLSFWAGQTPHSDPTPNRGNPNGSATVVDQANGSIKWVWDWSLEGTGQISAASLTHKDFGDSGLFPDGSLALEKAFGSMIYNMAAYSNDLSTYGGYSETKCNMRPIAFKDNGLGLCVYINGTSFVENTVRHPWVKPTLIEGAKIFDADNYQVVSTRTATLSRSFSTGYTMIGQDENNYYIMERDSGTATKIYVNTVSKSDFSVSAQAITVTESLARPSLTSMMVNNGIVSDGCIYWISGSDAKTFVRIDMAVPANTIVLTSSLSANIDQSQTPAVLNDGIIVGRNYLINGDYVYPTAARNQRRSDNNDEMLMIDLMANYKNSPLYNQVVTPSNNNYGRICNGGIIVPYLATVNNLQDVIVKSNNQTMRCEYTITFTEGV